MSFNILYMCKYIICIYYKSFLLFILYNFAIAMPILKEEHVYSDSPVHVQQCKNLYYQIYFYFFQSL